ncbi:MAG: hypothetical protein M3041_19615 [Acidobacteriota bacterium]|nr:hypothetical protein [Acidobacteriota bacterium]
MRRETPDLAQDRLAILGGDLDACLHRGHAERCIGSLAKIFVCTGDGHRHGDLQHLAEPDQARAFVAEYVMKMRVQCREVEKGSDDIEDNNLVHPITSEVRPPRPRAAPKPAT